MQRITALDYARVFTAYLVVFTHLAPDIPDVNRFIYTFHMPLFFLISGMLYKEWRGGKFLLQKLVIPFFTYTLTFYVVKLLLLPTGLFGTPHSTGSMLQNLLDTDWNAFLHTRQFTAVTTWFLIALAWCWLWHLIKEKNFKVFGILYLTILFYSLAFEKLPFYLSQGTWAYLFFILGHQRKEFLLTFIQTHRLQKMVLLFAISILGYLLNGHINMMLWNLGKLPLGVNFMTGSLIAITGSLAVLCLSACFQPKPFITNLAQALISILGYQFLFIYPYKYTVGYGKEWYLAFFYAIFVVLACWAISKISAVFHFISKNCRKYFSP